MEPEEFRFISSDGLPIVCFRWRALGRERGMVQIAHGMGEHIGRYRATIDALVFEGLTVYGNDHRGHGRTAPSARHVGDLGAGGFDLLVEDMVRLSHIARQRDPGLPLVLLGHSMGSFAAQQYVLEHSGMIDGLVFSGSGALDGLARLATTAAQGASVLNAPFEPARTPFDWLSRDPEAVDAFLADPLCFAALQPASLASFLGVAPRLVDAVGLHRIRKALPIYLLSGSEDPVGQQLEGLMVLIERYRSAGLRDISYDFYDGGRHEMLNETNRLEVLNRLLEWIEVIVDRPRTQRHRSFSDPERGTG